jgi:hypothetical protein
MHLAGTTTAADKSIGPSARKERGPQDDKVWFKGGGGGNALRSLRRCLAVGVSFGFAQGRLSTSRSDSLRGSDHFAQDDSSLGAAGDGLRRRNFQFGEKPLGEDGAGGGGSLRSLDGRMRPSLRVSGIGWGREGSLRALKRGTILMA